MSHIYHLIRDCVINIDLAMFIYYTENESIYFYYGNIKLH